MRAAVYVRRSKQEPGSHSIDKQTEKGLALVEERGWECDPEADVYVDNGVSGATAWGSRPAGSQLMDSLSRYDAVIFWKRDRLARSMVVFVNLQVALDEAGVALVGTDEHYDTTTAMGRAYVQFSMMMAELERGLTVERTEGNHLHLAAKGAWRGGHRPYGFRPVMDPERGVKVLIAEDEEADVVRELVDRTIDGESANSLAKELNARGVATAQGGQWSSATILKLLKRDLLRGYARYKGEVTMDNSGRPIQTHEPLISAERWRELQAALGAPTERKAPSKSFLRGFIYCAECGCGMGRSSTSYQCSSYKDHDSTCPGVAIGNRGIENLVAAKVTGVLAHPQAIEHIFRVQQERTEAEEARAAGRHEKIEKLRLRAANLEQAIALAESPDAVVRFTGLYDDTMEALRGLERESRDRNLTEGQWAQAVKEATRAVAEWGSLSLDEQRTMLAHVVERVEVAKSQGRGGSLADRQRRAVERVNVVLKEEWQGLNNEDVVMHQAEDWIAEHGWGEESMSELANARASGTT